MSVQVFVILPESSTTGKADTRLSTKMLSALMMGVSGWMNAIWWYVPMPSSPRVCFMKAGFGISHIWDTHRNTRRHRMRSLSWFIRAKGYFSNTHIDHRGATGNERRRKDDASHQEIHNFLKNRQNR